MTIKEKLNQLIQNNTIKSFDLNVVDQNGNVGNKGTMRNTEQLILEFNNGQKLTIETFCSGCLQDTFFMVS